MVSEHTYFNRDEAMARMRNNTTLLKRMMALFLGSEDFASLEAALGAQDYSTAESVAHGIKGVSGNLALTALYEIVTQLDNELKNGAPNGDTVSQYYQILEETKKVAAKLAEEL